jgi:hypothetical protein
VSFDAIPSLAVHLGPWPGLEERIPLDQQPERLDARWGAEKAREFLAAMRAFVVEARAEKLFASEREFFGEYEQDRARYPTFEAFMPRVIELFSASPRMRSRKARGRRASCRSSPRTARATWTRV